MTPFFNSLVKWVELYKSALKFQGTLFRRYIRVAKSLATKWLSVCVFDDTVLKLFHFFDNIFVSIIIFRFKINNTLHINTS